MYQRGGWELLVDCVKVRGIGCVLIVRMWPWYKKFVEATYVWLTATVLDLPVLFGVCSCVGAWGVCRRSFLRSCQQQQGARRRVGASVKCDGLSYSKCKVQKYKTLYYFCEQGNFQIIMEEKEKCLT